MLVDNLQKYLNEKFLIKDFPCLIYIIFRLSCYVNVLKVYEMFYAKFRNSLNIKTILLIMKYII